MTSGKSKNTRSNKTNTTSDSSTLETALKRFKESYEYQKDNWHAKWERDNKLYDNERYMIQYEGTSDTFVPMSFSLVETMTTAIVNANLRFAFKSGDPLRNIDDKPFNALLSEWWDEDQWDLAIEEGARETFTTGMSGFFLYWDGEADQPRMEGYAMRDLIIDPTIKKPADLQKRGAYAGRRYFVRKGQLDDIMILDIDEASKTYGQLVPRYKKTKDDTEGEKGEASDKQTKEVYSGSTLKTAEDDQDEIIEIWDVDRVVTIKNRKHVIEDVENPYKRRKQDLLTRQYIEAIQDTEDADKAIADAMKRAKAEARGIVPFWFMRNYRKLSLFYASSEINAIAKLQESLNDHTNMELDSIIKQLAPQKELDPAYEDWIDIINDEPGVVYPFRPGSLVTVTSAIAPTAFNNRMNMKNEIREATAVDQVTKGVSNTKDATATEVQAQLQQSGERIQSKARIFEKDGFYWFGWIIMNMAKLYINEPIVVSVPGGATITPEEAFERYGLRELPKGAGIFDPEDFSEEVQVRVSLEVDAQNKKFAEQRSATTAFQILIQDPSNNIEEIKRIFYPKMFDVDQEDIDAITTPEESPAGQDPMMAAAQGAGLPPEAPVAPEEVPQLPQEVAL